MRDNKHSDNVKELMMNEKMRSGEALKMIEAFKKHTPEYAEMKRLALVARFSALQEENPVRCKAAAFENKEALAPLKTDKAAYLEKLIGLVETHKVEHPDFNLTEKEYMDKKHREFMEGKIAEMNEKKAMDLDAKKKAMSEHNNEFMMALAIGVAAIAAGSGTLALVSFTTAYVIEEFSTVAEDLRLAQSLVDKPMTMERIEAASANKNKGMER